MASSNAKKKRPNRPGGDLQARPVHAPHGRVTPKGSTTPGGRYTAPIPREEKVGEPWVPWVMGALLIAGMLVIITNYMNLLPGDDPSNWYLLGGLGLITAGFIVATRWR